MQLVAFEGLVGLSFIHKRVLRNTHCIPGRAGGIYILLLRHSQLRWCEWTSSWRCVKSGTGTVNLKLINIADIEATKKQQQKTTRVDLRESKVEKPGIPKKSFKKTDHESTTERSSRVKITTCLLNFVLGGESEGRVRLEARTWG